MRTAEIALNPFSLMMEPALVLQAMERSTELRHLRRRTLRPLDKPAIPYSAATLQAMRDADDAIDAEDELRDGGTL